MKPATLRRALPGAAFAALVLTVWLDPLVTGRSFTGLDLLPYNLPMEKAIHDSYASARLPVWNPGVSGGRPLMPNPNAGALYPVRALLAPLPFPAAMRLSPPLHWALAGLGMLLLLRTLGIARSGAWIGAVTYVFSGVSVSDVFFPHVQPGVTLLPWIVWAVARRDASGPRRVLWLGALFALDFLAADVFTAGLAVAAAALWIALEADRAARLREAGRLAAGIALGALVAAPQIVATALWIPETSRAIRGMTLYEVTFFSIKPWRLLELVLPYPFGPTWSLSPREIWGTMVFNYRALSLFSTLYAGALAPIAVFRVWRVREPGLRFARALLLAGLAASVLPSLFPRSWATVHSPIALRNPEKFAVAIVLALAIFAARAYESHAARRGGRWPLAVLAGIAAAAGFAALSPAAAGTAAARLVNGRSDLGAAAAPQLPGILAEGGLLWAATLVALDAARSRRREARVLSLVLLTAVPVVATRRIAKVDSEREVFGLPPLAERLRRADPHGAFRVLGESIYRPLEEADPYELTDLGRSDEPRRAWTEHMQVLWGYGTVFNNDFDSGDLTRVESLRRVSAIAAGYRDSGAFFGNLALRWGIRLRKQHPVSGYVPVGGSPTIAWDELQPVFPDVRLATRWREVTSAVEGLDAIRDVGPGELLLETGRRAAGTSRPGRLRVLEKSACCLRLEADAPDPSWLFVLRDFWRHRTIVLDGRPVEAVPAYLAFSAVPVPAGRHAIAWTERVPGGRVSILGPLAAAAGFAALAAAGRRRRGAP